MRIGIFARTFPGDDPVAVLGEVRSAGYDTSQFNLSCLGLDPVPRTVPDDTGARVRAAAERAGVALPALSGTWNMAHPDPAVRRDGLVRLATVVDVAAAAGIRLVTLCTGTRDPDDKWAPHPDNTTAAAWADLRTSMAAAVELANRADIELGIEPEQANVVTNVPAALALAGELDTDRLRIVLDPANLFDTADPDTAREMVARAVEQAGPAVALAHAKDRTGDGRVVAPGQGVVDFPDLVARLRAVGFDGALVTHGITADQAPAVAARLAGWVA